MCSEWTAGEVRTGAGDQVESYCANPKMVVVEVMRRVQVQDLKSFLIKKMSNI